MKDHFTTLRNKLNALYAEGMEIGLSPEECVIYGIDDADEWPFDESEDFKEQEEN